MDLVTQGSLAYFYAYVNMAVNATYSVYVRALAGDPDLFIRTDGLTNKGEEEG